MNEENSNKPTLIQSGFFDPDEAPERETKPPPVAQSDFFDEDELAENESEIAQPVETEDRYSLVRQDDRWVLMVDFDNRDIAKDLNFRWDAEEKHWYTLSRTIAFSAAQESVVACRDTELAHADLAPLGVDDGRFPLERRANRWVLHADYDNRQVAKDLGFRWDKSTKEWYTESRSLAFSAINSDWVRNNDPDLTSPMEESRYIESSADISSVVFPIPDNMEYRDYQKDGMRRLIAHPGTLLGDEMGLGKTIQVIGAMNAIRHQNPDPHFLVVCPTNLTLLWERELTKWCVPGDSGQQPSIGIAGKSFPQDCETVIVPYSRADQYKDELAAKEWDLAALDEAHYLKNGKAKRTKAVLGAGSARNWSGGVKADIRVAMTGTPIPNRPIEVWNILNWLNRDDWRKRSEFAIRYCDAGHNGYGWDESGASNLDELQDRLQSIMLRRVKSEVLKELPPKERQIIEIPRGYSTDLLRAIQEEELAIEKLRQAKRLKRKKVSVEDLQGIGVGFENISAIRHQTALAKTPAVIDHVKDLLENSDKIVVFAHHRDVLDMLHENLSEFNPVMLRGGDSAGSKQDAVDTFQDDPDCRVFVGSIQAAGVGLTLTAAQTVVFAELDWVPGNVTQAEDRCHRIGQTGSVLVHHIVAQDSIDANITHTIVDKQAVIDLSLGDAEPEAYQQEKELPDLPF